MAFNKTSMDQRFLDNFGAVTEGQIGMTVMVSGKATVTCSKLSRVDWVLGCAQGATGVGFTVMVTATAGNTFDIETVDENGDAAGTSVVMWLAVGQPKA